MMWRIRARFDHYDFKSVGHFASKLVWYSGREVMDVLGARGGEDLQNAGIRRTRKLKTGLYYRLPRFFRVLCVFLFRYIFQLGFLDGVPGLIYHFMYSFMYRFLVDAKLYEAQKTGKYDTDRHRAGGEGLMRVLHVFTVPVTRNGITMFALQRLPGTARGGRGGGLCLPRARWSRSLRAEIEAAGARRVRSAAKAARRPPTCARSLPSCAGRSTTSSTPTAIPPRCFSRCSPPSSAAAARAWPTATTPPATTSAQDRRLRPFFYKSYTAAAACGRDAGRWLFARPAFHGAAQRRGHPPLFQFDPAARARARGEAGHWGKRAGGRPRGALQRPEEPPLPAGSVVRTSSKPARTRDCCWWATAIWKRRCGSRRRRWASACCSPAACRTRRPTSAAMDVMALPSLLSRASPRCFWNGSARACPRW